MSLVTLESHIVEIKVTEEMLQKAHGKAEQMGCLNKHSMMKGSRNVEGVLGELAALSYLANAVPTDNYDNDLRIGKVTIDVKTKRLTMRPRLYYDCTVYGYNPNQNCHVYLFAGVKDDHSVVWLSGWLPKPEFYEIAEFCPKGSQRPLGNNKMLTYKEDNYVIQVKDLNQVVILQNIHPKE